jgi:Zn-dependent oligopeptidase
MNRKDRIKALVAAACGWGESDTEFLTALEDAQFDRIEAQVKTNIANATKVVALETAVTELKANSRPAPKTLEEALGQMPAELADVMRSGVSLASARKEQLIGAIKANAGNKFSDEVLRTKSISDLESLASLASAGAPDFGLQAGGMRANASEADAIPDAPVPVWN